MPTAVDEPASNRLRLFLSVCLLALIVRGIHLLALRDLEFFQVLGLDAEFYDRWARSLVAGEVQAREPYFQGPLYPWFLSLVYRLPGGDVLAAQLAQLVLGTITAALAASIADELFGRRTAWLCGVLASCYPFAIFLETHLIAAPLIACLVTMSVWLCVRSPMRHWQIALAGLLAGLAAIGSGLVLAAAALFALILVIARRRAVLRSVSIFVAGFALGILPVTVHNLRAGELVLLSSNGGINYFIGNHAGASGAYDPIEGVEFFQRGMPHDGGSIAEASRRAGRELSASQASAYWLRQSLDWQLGHPISALALLGRKLLYALGDYEIPQIENFDWAKREAALLRLSPFRAGLLIPLAVVGLAYALRTAPRARVLALGLTSYWLALAAFFVTARFRSVAMPLSFVFSAYALSLLPQVLRGRSPRRSLSFFVPLASLVLLGFTVAPAGVRESSRQLLSYSRGVTAMQRGDFVLASGQFAAATRENPAHAQSWANLGYCQEQLGQAELAVASYQTSLRLKPDDPRVLAPLAQLLLRQGDYPAAELRLRELTQIEPSNWLAWASLGDLAMQRGDEDAMRAHWQRVLAGSEDAELLAMARERLGQP